FVGGTPYLSAADSPFNGIGFSYFHRETFEDNAFDVPGVVASAGGIIGPGGLTDSVDADDGAIDGSGTNGHSFFSRNGAIGIQFTFSAALPGGLPTHAGVVWTDGAGSTVLEAFGPGMAPLGNIGLSIADNSFAGTTAEDHFFGWNDPAGILALRIR